MIAKKIQGLINTRRCTMLGVGPMSKNCIDAAISAANENQTTLMLIASRRQIDAESLGGGYVNNWCTHQFADYVSARDKRGQVLICRDHGGPWQNSSEFEQGLSARQAMRSAKESFRQDIESGFDIIHIDTSVDPHGSPDPQLALDRLFDLYDYCWSEARRVGREVAFEIGTEEQSGSTNTPEELDNLLFKVTEFCEKQKIPKPLFVVIQTGTKVLETQNVGSFDSPVRVHGDLPSEIQIPKMIEICNRHGILMKEHNGDYLSDHALQWHPRLGIHAANVAPEFGVTETRALIDILEKHKLTRIADEFLQIAYESGKWKKWMLPNSSATDTEKSIIAGHYVFSKDSVNGLKSQASEVLAKKGIELEAYLQQAVMKAINRYMVAFRLLVPR
ncbi:MAG: class II D-tagatose-bisphosphate aldolase, non-catalytic subunit [Leptolyngbyaceae bacterium]|nr:class II D-tagatose-bisphosphate aldolase, non-catalytic subunit [Leptolyngbyaceae bacterium]